MAESYSSDWSTLSELAEHSEFEVRRILRLNTRNADLDAELLRISRHELFFEVTGDQDAAAFFKNIPGFEHLVRNSPAFGKYLSTFLYFSVRFAAGRLGIKDASNENYNDRPLALLPPPSLNRPFPDQLEAWPIWGVPATVLNFLSPPRPAQRPTGPETEALRDRETAFTLWLRGLREPGENFLGIAADLYEWASGRAQFYLELEKDPLSAVSHGWHAHNPISARCAVTELYLLARILRAEVTPEGLVRYGGESWLSLLGKWRNESAGNEQLTEWQRIERVLQSVFGFACDLIQNSAAIVDFEEKCEARPDLFNNENPSNLVWRKVFDNEMDQIARQRDERLLNPQRPSAKEDPDEDPPEADGWDPKCGDRRYWSQRSVTGAYEADLVGLALSGGGIRSATFALGILEQLKELKLLRRLDYLSTVSGGGYIGAWLMGNVLRTRYWLSEGTSWLESITHLRNYSKYLSPNAGFLSADTWVIWGTWVRNALLIQLTTAAWVSSLLIGILFSQSIFHWLGERARFVGVPWTNYEVHWLLVIVFITVMGLIGRALWRPKPKPPTETENSLIVWLALLGSTIVAASLADRTHSWPKYSDILKAEVKDWIFLALALIASLSTLSQISIRRESKFNRTHIKSTRYIGSIGAATAAIAVLYLGLAGVTYFFGWTHREPAFSAKWYEYVFGPSLVLISVTLAVMVFIGLIGKSSADWRREWWTRYGSWLALYGTGFLALLLAAVFSPIWLSNLYKWSANIAWSAVGAWLVSAIAGLVAGNSGRTKGKGQGSSSALEWIAPVGGGVFIIGAILTLSTILRFILVSIWLDSVGPWHQTLWTDLNKLTLQALPVSVPFLGDLSIPVLIISVALVVLLAATFSWRFDLNTFGLSQFYRNRLVRCYLGATRWRPGWRQPDRFTGFDENDDLNVATLKWRPTDEQPFRGPFPIINCSLNLGGSSDLSVKTRQSASFFITPLACGTNRPRVGFAPVRKNGGFAGGLFLGHAIAISGAAASPNMGYNTSPLASILLTLFNVRLGWWFPNPGHAKWNKPSPPIDPTKLIQEFLGLADEKRRFVNVSDGGHFENLGIYELVRRRTKVIIACDGECDSNLTFGSLGNLVRICETDFGARIDIDVTSIREREDGFSQSHCAVGKIHYSNGSEGYLIYLKASITGDEDVGVAQYRAGHPAFPHESTADQFFSEDQFESYRRLGRHIAKHTFDPVKSEPVSDPLLWTLQIAKKLYDIWTPSGSSPDAFVRHTSRLDEIWELLRTSSDLENLLRELNGESVPANSKYANAEIVACAELFQLMENVFLDLRLDDFWQHPDNRGWALLFETWAKSPRVSAAWPKLRQNYGIRFEYFCERRLSLPAGRPVARQAIN